MLVWELLAVSSLDERAKRDDFETLRTFFTFSARNSSSVEDSRDEISETDVSKIISAGSFEVKV